MQIQIKENRGPLTPGLAAFAERKLHFSLARLQDQVRSATVRFEDLNGPKGGIDIKCSIEVRTCWNASIRIEERDADRFTALARAAERAGRAVRRQAALRSPRTALRPAAPSFGD